MIDVDCLQVWRWSGEASKMLPIERRRYRLWWSVKGSHVGVVGVMVKEVLYEEVVEV